MIYRFDAPLQKLGSRPSDARARDKLASEIVRALHDEWVRQGGAEHCPPSLSTFNWSRFAATGALTIVKIESNGDAYFSRIGRALVEERGRPLQERDLTGEERDALLDHSKRCAMEGSPCHEYMRFEIGDGQPLSFERLLTPFRIAATKP